MNATGEDGHCGKASGRDRLDTARITVKLAGGGCYALAPDVAKNGIGGDAWWLAQRTRARTSFDLPLCRSFIPVAISAALISLAAYIPSGAPMSLPSPSHFWTV
jgi:hypothetical protein